MHANIAYRITPAQIAAAQQAKADFDALCQADPTIILPLSFRQMILNERHGWIWNTQFGQYEKKSH